MPQLPISPKQMAELIRLANTVPGKKLVQLLQQDRGPALRAALSREDYLEARSIIQEFLRRSDVQDLLRELGR